MAKKNILTHAKKSKADQLALEGRLDEARTLYESVCRTDRLDVEAWVKLSVANRRVGHYQEAETCGRQAVKLQPTLALAHYALASALHSQGKMEEALPSYHLSIKLQPDFADAHYLLGNALHDMGQMDEALASYHRAIALRPNYFEALSDLGAALIQLGEIDDASSVLNRALSLRPGSPDALCNIGSILQVGGRIAEAREMFEQALRITPDSPDAIASLAALLEKTAYTEESKALTERGLVLAPENPALILVAARLARREKRLQDAVNLLERVRGKNLRPELSGEIHILLGQILDQLGDAEHAYPLIVEGNLQSAKASLRGEADKGLYLQRVDAISRQLTSDLANAPPYQDATNEPEPVFLIGFPRSGTTLMEQILDSHPAIQTLEEKPTVAAMVNTFLDMAGERENALAELNTEQIAQLRKVYTEQVNRHITRQPGTLLVDKMPLNTVGVPVIWRVFPNAKFILAIRHPCDVCLSCFMQSFAVNIGMANFFTLESTAHTYAKVMGLWQAYAQKLPIRYHRVRYEDLVANVEKESRELLDFLGVGWDNAVLDHTEHAIQRRIINTPSYHQVTQPIYHHATYRWKRYAREFAPLLPTLQPFIELFGYVEEGS